MTTRQTSKPADGYLPWQYRFKWPAGPAHAVVRCRMHFCVGLHLARMEINVMVDALMRRVPDFGIGIGIDMFDMAAAVRAMSLVLTHYMGTCTAHTAIANVLGWPAISGPAGLVNGLPVGLQIMRLPQSESRMLQLAQAFLSLRSPSGGEQT